MKKAKELGFSTRSGIGPFIISNDARKLVQPPSVAVEDEVNLKWNQYYVRVRISRLLKDGKFVGDIESTDPINFSESLPFGKEKLRFESDYIWGRIC